jgi:anti-anti-sigma regulatory factor
MTTSTIYLIYSVIGILALGSIIFAIINWIKLSSTSSAINDLQAEIDKKTREFDSIKKENAQLKNQIPAQDGEENNAEGKQGPKIEIVRNIRSEFEDATAQTPSAPGPASYFVGDQSESDDQQPQETQTDYPSVTTSESIRQDAVPAEKNRTIKKGSIISGDDKNDDEALDVVDEDKDESSVQTAQLESITIPLYSKSAKHADFKKLRNTLSQALDAPQQQHVNIDLKGIPSFNDKEIKNLQKICQMVEHKNGSVAFINCKGKLATLLSKDTTLGKFIQKD